jgi:hypothetical protein
MGNSSNHAICSVRDVNDIVFDHNSKRLACVVANTDGRYPAIGDWSGVASVPAAGLRKVSD